MKIKIYVRGQYVRKSHGMPEFEPGYSLEFTTGDDIPEPYADHVFEMLRAGQKIRDTGLEVIRIQD